MPAEDRRRQLQAEARRLLEDRGVEGLSIRDLAAAAGVSRQTPYLYFPAGAVEVVAALATEGFQELVAALRGAEPDGEAAGDDPVEALVGMVMRYVRFGVEHPRLYRAMFHAILVPRLEGSAPLAGESPDGEATFAVLAEAKQAAWLAIAEAVAAARGSSAADPGDDPDSLAVAALAHGLVGEFIDEGLGERLSGGVPWSGPRRAMSRAVIDVLVCGILALRG